jgi:hypothetical protein
VKKELGKVREARRSLEKVCGRLLHPTIGAVASSAAEVTSAVACLQDLERRVRASQRRGEEYRGLATEMEALRRQARQAEALLEAAGQFYAGWARLITLDDSATANYTAGGRPGLAVVGNHGGVALDG